MPKGWNIAIFLVLPQGWGVFFFHILHVLVCGIKACFGHGRVPPKKKLFWRLFFFLINFYDQNGKGRFCLPFPSNSIFTMFCCYIFFFSFMQGSSSLLKFYGPLRRKRGARPNWAKTLGFRSRYGAFGKKTTPI